MTVHGSHGTDGWHARRESLGEWVDGVAGPMTSISVEQHLMACAVCRAVVAELVPNEPVAEGWDAVLDRIETSTPSVVERVLVRLGVRPADAVVVAAAGTLRAAWSVAMVVMLGFAFTATTLASSGGIWLFLLAAPLIPVAGVAAVFGPTADPSFEATQAAPYSMVRLALLRTAAVLVTSVPVTLGAGLLLPMPALAVVAWLLPAVGFVTVVLTASSWVDPDQAAAAVGAGWLVAVAFAARTGDPMTLFVPLALTAYTAILAIAALVLAHRLRAAVPSGRLW